jgi:two-component system response regulator WspF
VRIAIVNDLPTACEALRRVVSRLPGHAVAWIATGGEEAIARAARDRPDLILMDLIMPGLDGVETTRRIMRQSPCAILVVTASVSGAIGLVYDCLGAGAVDAVDTPVLGPHEDIRGASALVDKIRTVERLVGPAQPVGGKSPRVDPPSVPPLLVIGASTGGPAAVCDLLGGLSPDMQAALVIVQHIDRAFSAGLAEWLGERSGLRVGVAREGERPTGGRVLVAGTDDHLVLRPDGGLGYTAEPRALPYRPSVDVFFESVAAHWPAAGAAAILTGMGQDGAKGLSALRRLGWLTFAQDEPSSVVWSMPRAAIEAGAACHVLPPARIAATAALRLGVPPRHDQRTR